MQTTTTITTPSQVQPIFGVPAGEQTFDPAIHLAYEKPQTVFSMDDLALSKVNAPCKTGLAGPFPLASYEGVKALRQSLFQPHVLDHHMMTGVISGPHAQLRGVAPEASKFIYDFWNHPATLAAVSEAAGEELIPVLDYEVCSFFP